MATNNPTSPVTVSVLNSATTMVDLEKALQQIREISGIRVHVDQSDLTATKVAELHKGRMSPYFNNPTANVFFKTSDNVIYRMHAFYLKANR